MPWLSKDEGSGASKTLKPFVATGDNPKPNLFVSSSLGDP
jgi:hypothetical protein